MLKKTSRLRKRETRPNEYKIKYIHLFLFIQSGQMPKLKNNPRLNLFID